MLHATDPSLFSQVPWEGVGIAASLFIAVVLGYELVSNYRTSRRKDQQRDILNGFRGEGHELLERCTETTRSESEAEGWTLQTEVDEWAVRTEAYLQQSFGGHGRVLTFRSGAGIPPIETASKHLRGLERGIIIRLVRLQEFVAEIR